MDRSREGGVVGAPESRAALVRAALVRWLPTGRTLPDTDWARRHRWVVVLLALHAVGLPLLAIARGHDVRDSLLQGAGIALLALAASWGRLPRGARSALGAIGLVICSSVLVDISGGAIEAHFHFFVMVPVVAMYEDWSPFGLAVAYVLFEHGVVGTLSPHSVFSHQGAHEDPWLWAAVHAGFFAAACIGALVNWRFAEDARRSLTSAVSAYDHQAHHDQLTGLANRTHLARVGQDAVERARVVGEPVSLLMIDLDRFKEVNDTLGHTWGDDLLVQVARRLSASTRPGDALVRLGGDEFALLLPGGAPDAAAAAAARLQQALHAPFDVAGVELDVDASVGVASWDPVRGAQPTDVVADLLRRADIAMYEAKASTGGVRVYADADDVASLDRLTLLTDLRRGIAAGELVLDYQPKVRIDGGGVVGAEALVRWRHPQRGLLAPAAFLPLAETTALMRPLTQTVLGLALDDATRWWRAGTPVQVAVNISATSLQDDDFAAGVLAQLGGRGLPPELLRLELTETAIMSDAAQAGGTLSALAEHGIGVSIDDFGTGYSSMSYLRALPVDELKVDRSFVVGLGTDLGPGASDDAVPGGADDVAIVTSAIQLAHSLGMTVVAEGIENGDALAELERLGCDTAQGYHLARPMPAEALTRWLDAHGTPPATTAVPRPRRAQPEPATS